MEERQKEALATTDTIVYFEPAGSNKPGELGLEERDGAYVCRYLDRRHHSLHMFKDVAKILADRFGW